MKPQRNNQKSHTPATTEKKQCFFCTNNKMIVDYKDVSILKKFVSSFHKIAPRRRSGLCALHQRKVGKAIKQSRIAGLMPYLPR